MNESAPSSVDKNAQPVTEDIGPQVSEQGAAGEDVQGKGSPVVTAESGSEASEQSATDEDAQVRDTGISKTDKIAATSVDGEPPKRRKKKRKPNKEAAERRLLGRQAMCKRIDDLAPHMLKTVKLRILGQFLDSTKGLDDLELANRIKKDSRKLADRKRIVEILSTIDPDVNRRILKEIIVYGVLLQEETHSLEERRLDEKVIDFEKSIVKRAKDLDFFNPKKHDPVRWHHRPSLNFPRFIRNSILALCIFCL
jgi:hypothetical protein